MSVSLAYLCQAIPYFFSGRGVRVAYGDGLENRCRCKPTVGSNPPPSAYLERIRRANQYGPRMVFLYR